MYRFCIFCKNWLFGDSTSCQEQQLPATKATHMNDLWMRLNTPNAFAYGTIQSCRKHNMDSLDFSGYEFVSLAARLEPGYGARARHKFRLEI